MAREASEQTLAVRELLEKNPNLTHSEAKPLLDKKGFNVDGPTYNAIKFQWSRSRKDNAPAKPAAPKKGRRTADPVNNNLQLSDTSIPTALQFVTQSGGVDAVKKMIEEKEAEVTQLRQALATFEHVRSMVIAS